MAKKFVYYLLICLAVVGAIGGIGYLVYFHQYPTAAGVAVLAYLAWPRLWSMVKSL